MGSKRTAPLGEPTALATKRVFIVQLLQGFVRDRSVFRRHTVHTVHCVENQRAVPLQVDLM